MRSFLLLLLCLATSTTYAADLPDARDHPDVRRFSGSEIIAYDTRSFDEYDLQTSSYVNVDFKTGLRVYKQPPLHLEGARTTIWYEAAGDVSALEVVRNYQTDLESRGFQILYNSGSDSKVEQWNNEFFKAFKRDLRRSRGTGVFTEGDAKRTRVLSAKRDREDGTSVYVSVVTIDWDQDVGYAKIKRGAYAAVEVIEPKPMKQSMVRVTAEDMSKAITTTGRATLYGILFDTNKSEIKPASRPALEEIAKLLKAQPALRLHIVGHTDNAGGLDSNLKLSKQRADAVLAALRSDFGIAAQRLTANGVAYLAPVATNATEDGRAKNRRVELVPQ